MKTRHSLSPTVGAFRMLLGGLAVAALADGVLAQTVPDAPVTMPVAAAPAADSIGQSLRNEGNAALARALDWLAARQNEAGHWSNPEYPALTALPLWAFAQSDHPKKKDAAARALKYLRTCIQPDGGIYRPASGHGGGLANYNTAICMVALHALGDPSLTPVVRNARKFVAAAQHLGNDVYRGGFGYDQSSGRAYADLNNLVIAAEGMRLTESAEDTRPAGEPKTDLDWKAAREFLDRTQNKADAGAEEAGGFFYRPGESKAGVYTNAQGKVFFRSYASMTYAGLLSLIYADVDRSDPRTKSAFDWAMKHWSLDENPGMGSEGQYYFYNILTKALAAYGRDTVPGAGGNPFAWRAEVVRKLLKIQKFDEGATGMGYWVNENNRWWEADPVLVTAYSCLTLELALGK